MAQQTLNTPRETTHQRIAAALEAIEQNMSDEHEAVNIDYDNTYSDLSADNVQEAIDELNSEKANTTDLGTAASKDVPTSGNATSTQVVMGNDSRLTDARPASDVSAWAKASTKPTYTASEVGTYTSTEIDNKYVAKETGKGLSTNDYTTADKNKLAGIEAEANKTVVDSAMSDSSTNPLQNKVITAELAGTKTTQGNPLTITDAALVNAVNLSIDLEPIQEGSGTPSPDNVRPISGRSEVEIDRVGKNLYVGSPSFDGYSGAGWTKQTETYNGHDVYMKNAAWGGLYKLVDLPVGTYTFSCMVKTNDSANVYIYMEGYSATATTSPTNIQASTSTNWTKISLTFTVSVAGSVSLRVERSTSGNIYISEYQLEKGSTATTYEPYAGKTYTIQFGQTVYGGELDVTKGELVVDRASVDLGSLSWEYKASLSSMITALVGINPPTSDAVPVNAISSVCKIISANDRTTGTEIRLYVFANSNVVYIRDSGYTDATAFKNAMTGQTLVYELATPYTIQLTPQQIKLLENTNTIYTDYEGDTITIEYQPNNAIGEAVRVVEESYDAIIQNLIDRITALENS